VPFERDPRRYAVVAAALDAAAAAAAAIGRRTLKAGLRKLSPLDA
jgi:hypothetical protein